MKIIVKTQSHLDELVKITPMIRNIYYDDDMEYVSINWEDEHIEINKVKNSIIVKRVKNPKTANK